MKKIRITKKVEEDSISVVQPQTDHKRKNEDIKEKIQTVFESGSESQGEKLFFSETDLMRGIILSEVLGKPVSKRRRRNRY